MAVLASAAPLIDTLRARGFAAETCALEMGDNNQRVYVECEDRNVRSIIRPRETHGERIGPEKTTSSVRSTRLDTTPATYPTLSRPPGQGELGSLRSALHANAEVNSGARDFSR